MRGIGNYQEGQGHQDRDVIAAAVSQPASGFGENYRGNRSSLMAGQNYGDTASVYMDQAPSRGAVLDREARQDGVNPYSGEPLHPQQQPRTYNMYSNAPVVVPGPTNGVTQMRDPSQDSGNANGVKPQYTAASAPAEAGGMYATAAPGSLTDDAWFTAASLQQQQQRDVESPRPSGKRQNSTPHVPGEYPRNSIGGAPTNFA